jgi:protein TonB
LISSSFAMKSIQRMSIAYPDWSPGADDAVEVQPARGGMAAHLHGRQLVGAPRHRWTSVVISLAGHGALLYALLYLSFAVPKQAEMQTITVSVAAAQVSQPEPPPMPKLEPVPQVAQPNLPQIDTAAPPSPTAIRAAPPPPQTPTETEGANAAPLTPPRFDAGYLNNPAPVYPNMSRRLRETGIVQLRVRVSAAGEPQDIQLFKSSGHERLDASARAAVQKWKFEPARQNGSSVEAWVIVPIEFSLDKRDR